MALALIKWGIDVLSQSAAQVVVVRESSTYRLEELGTTATLRYQHGFVLLVGGISLGVFVLGLLLLRWPKARKFGGILSGMGGLFAFLGAPGMWTDRVVITPTEIHQVMGPWFLPRDTIGFRYADVRLISIQRVKKGRSTSRVWLVSYTNGDQDEIDPGDLWDDSEDMIVDRLRGYGVQFDPALIPRSAVRAQAVVVGLRRDGAGSFGLRPTPCFGRHDTIYAVVPTVGAAPAAVISARWLYQTGELVAAQVDTIAPTGPANTEFHILKHGAWPVGRYRVEISLDGLEAAAATFEVVP